MLWELSQKAVSKGNRRWTIGLLQELEMLFVGFEMHLNVPSESITANNLLRNVHIRGD